MTDASLREKCTFRPDISATATWRTVLDSPPAPPAKNTRELEATLALSRGGAPGSSALVLPIDGRSSHCSSPRSRAEKAGNSPERSDVFERLHKSRAEREAKLAAMRDFESTIDLKTGQRLFAPATGRAPINERNPSSAPVGEYLFGTRHERNDIRDSLRRKQAELLRNMRSAPRMSKGSQRLHARVQRRRHWQLFGLLLPSDSAESAAWLKLAGQPPERIVRKGLYVMVLAKM